LSGIAQRLNNLGYGPVPCGLEVTASDISSAVGLFQSANDIEPSGRVDDATREKVKELHGS
jgi:hypothetical protein